MLSLDDYFMVEVEKKETDPDTGKKVTKKVGWLILTLSLSLLSGTITGRGKASSVVANFSLDEMSVCLCVCPSQSQAIPRKVLKSSSSNLVL